MNTFLRNQTWKNFKILSFMLGAIFIASCTSISGPKSESDFRFWNRQPIQLDVAHVEFKDMNDTLKLHRSDWKFILKKRKISSNRQALKNNFFTIDGSIYLAKVSFLKRYKSFVKENSTKIFVSSISPMIDINNIIDFKIAEFLKRKIYKTN